MPSILSVSGSPVTTAGTLAIALQNQSANTVFAGPTSGGATTPNFRALVAGDLASVLTTKGDLLSFSTLPVRVPIGSTNGFIPVQDSTQTAGWSWQSGQTGAGSNITPDTHPVVQNAQNDEFEQGTVIDTSGSRFSEPTAWTAFNIGSTSTAIAGGSLLTTYSLVAGTNQTGYTQPIPAGTWAYTCKEWIGASITGGGSGISVINGANSRIIWIGISNVSSTTQLVVQKLTNATTFSSNAVATAFTPGQLVAAVGGMITQHIYLQIAYDGTTIFYRASFTGAPGSFVTVFSEIPATFLAGVPTLIGLTGQSATATAASATVGVYDWFRKTA